ncbi:MAG: MFS transporter, partial [Alphaproteobacteria bacterium]
HTNDHTGDTDLVQISAGLLLLFGAGSVVGPIIAGYAMEHLGPNALFGYVATVAALTALFAVYRMTRAAPVPLDDQTDFVAVSPTAGVAALDPRTEIEDFEEAFVAEQAAAAEATLAGLAEQEAALHEGDGHGLSDTGVHPVR